MDNDDYIKHLKSMTDDNENELVDFFVNSELPNMWFLQHFIPPYEYPFHKKKYWELFANVIVKRGVESISKEDVILMTWFQDGHWPGFFEILVFIRENTAFFKDFFLTSINKAFITNDEIWLIMLLVQLVVPSALDLPIVDEIRRLALKHSKNPKEDDVVEFNKRVEEFYDKYRYPDNYKHGDEV